MAEQGGLLSFLNSPTGMGLLSAVGAGLAGARRGQPINALGMGLMSGVQGYVQGQDLQQQQAFNQQRSKLFDAQMQNYQAEADARRAALEQQQRQREYMSTIGKVTSPRLDAQPNQADTRTMLGLGFSPEFVRTYATADTLSLPKVARTVEVDDGNGGKATMQLDEYGRQVGNSLPAYIPPVQVNRGGSIDFVKPTQGASLPVTMSPAERDASARGWRGLRIQEDNARRDSQAVTYQQDGEGNFVALPTKVAPGSVVRGLPVVAGPGMTPMRGASKDSKLTESEGKTTLYLNQMRDASNTLSDLERRGINPSPVLVGMAGNGITNVFAPNGAQQVAQARNQWAEAYLRVKTGAAATPGEVENNVRTFFPVPGDSAAVVQQKAEARAAAERAMVPLAGKGAQTVPAPKSGAPAAGQVIDGYRFKGGNPADRNNWEKI